METKNGLNEGYYRVCCYLTYQIILDWRFLVRHEIKCRKAGKMLRRPDNYYGISFAEILEFFDEPMSWTICDLVGINHDLFLERLLEQRTNSFDRNTLEKLDGNGIWTH